MTLPSWLFSIYLLRTRKYITFTPESLDFKATLIANNLYSNFSKPKPKPKPKQKQTTQRKNSIQWSIIQFSCLCCLLQSKMNPVNLFQFHDLDIFLNSPSQLKWSLWGFVWLRPYDQIQSKLDLAGWLRRCYRALCSASVRRHLGSLYTWC